MGGVLASLVLILLLAGLLMVALRREGERLAAVARWRSRRAAWAQGKIFIEYEAVASMSVLRPSDFVHISGV